MVDDLQYREPSADHVLDNVVWHSLQGPHRRVAEGSGRAARYPSEISPFAGLPDDPDDAAWEDFATLVGRRNIGVLFRDEVAPPSGWRELQRIPTRQMLATDVQVESIEPVGRGEPVEAAHGLEVVVLGPADVPEMVALVAATEPGPFGPRTHELGAYLGLRDRDGHLVAMAGERMRAGGHVEISAVCTDPAHRGRGLAALLVRRMVGEIRSRGEVPFLHVATENTGAARLYEHLGFVDRRAVVASILQAPR